MTYYRATTYGSGSIEPVEVKLCVNCKHYRITRCTHPSNKAKLSLVDGLPMTAPLSAFELRERTDLCGPEGNWFEKYPVEKLVWGKLGISGLSQSGRK